MPSLKVNWNRIQIPTDVNPVLKRFERWLLEKGYRETFIDAYLSAVRKFLDDVKTTNPYLEDARVWHSNLLETRRARSTINLWSVALKAFYKSRGMELILPCLKVDNKIPYFFSESDVKAILDSCSNFKHLVMLTLMFHCMLRASDLANLQDEDIDLKEHCLRIRNGKGGKSAILPIPSQCVQLLDQYLQIRPRVQVKGKYYLFYTDQQNKWNR